MPEETTTNGMATPVTPKMNGLALTEYTATPTPPSEREQRIPGLPPSWGVPEAFLLPNGYPDVFQALSFPLNIAIQTNYPILVSPVDLDIQGLRCH